jgi:hypothetical protein
VAFALPVYKKYGQNNNYNLLADWFCRKGLFFTTYCFKVAILYGIPQAKYSIVCGIEESV